MINKYGLVALKTVVMMNLDTTLHINECWDQCASEVFDSKSSIEKGCPKNCFLGLCEEGYVKGIPKGKYTKSRLNKAYGVRACELIAGNQRLVNNKMDLWRMISDKSHNSQMDVVIALYNNNYLDMNKDRNKIIKDRNE